MLRIPRRYSHFVYGVIQSGLTCAIAAAIATYPLAHAGEVLKTWLQAWTLSWVGMLPVVIFAAPLILRFSTALTRNE